MGGARLDALRKQREAFGFGGGIEPHEGSAEGVGRIGAGRRQRAKPRRAGADGNEGRTRARVIRSL